MRFVWLPRASARRRHTWKVKSERFHLFVAIFWFCHIPPAVVLYFTLPYEAYARGALLYTVVVSALTIGLEHLIKRSTIAQERKDEK